MVPCAQLSNSDLKGSYPDKISKCALYLEPRLVVVVAVVAAVVVDINSTFVMSARLLGKHASVKTLNTILGMKLHLSSLIGLYIFFCM